MFKLYVCTYAKKIMDEANYKTKFWATRARFKASAGHIWPTGRMLRMPVLDRYKAEYTCFF